MRRGAGRFAIWFGCAAVLAGLLALGAGAFSAGPDRPKPGGKEPDYSAELPRIPPVEPKDAPATFRVQPGFRIEQVAAEPLVNSPVAAAWDERGRMYVVEMRGYSERRNEALSRIRLLVDGDGDGRYDRATVFADKLLWPTAVACWDGGVFVGDAPDVWYLKDTDGDGVADVKRKVFTGFGISNVQGLLNTFLWHFDNRIHGSASSNGGEVRRADPAGGERGSGRGGGFSFCPPAPPFPGGGGGGPPRARVDHWGAKVLG